MSLERLMRSASRGDAVSLERIVRELAPEVYRFLVGMLGDEEEAEDAMGETFVRVARSADRFGAEGDVRGWVFGIARLVAADVRPTPSARPVGLPTGTSDDVDWCRKAMRALPPEERELIVGRELLGWDAETISSTLGVPPDEVTARLSRARELLLAPGEVVT